MRDLLCKLINEIAINISDLIGSLISKHDTAVESN